MMNNAQNGFMAAACLPDGKGGFGPCPDLLTEQEAIRFLRLDEIDIERPQDTLRRYRLRGLLKAVQVSKAILYERQELLDFVQKLKEENPR